jgi:leucyl-tRNA synthetase
MSSMQYQRARLLRKQGTLTERMLWNALLPLKQQIKFRRQHPLHPYIADFACISAKLIVEVDGQSHDTQLGYDAKRDVVLRKRGWTIIRFTNEDVLENLDGVVETILQKVKTGPGPTSKN